MKTIETKYHGATNSKPSRISATTQRNPRIYLSYDYALIPEENHQAAAAELLTKMEWSGRMVGGHIKDGMAWVFVKGSCSIGAEE